MTTWLQERTRAMWLTLACSRSKQWRRGRQRQLAGEVNGLRSQPMKRKAKNSLERECHKLETMPPWSVRRIQAKGPCLMRTIMLHSMGRCRLSSTIRGPPMWATRGAAWTGSRSGQPTRQAS